MPRIRGRILAAVTAEHYGGYTATALNRRHRLPNVYVQSDWHFPSLASEFGWRPRPVRGCDHDATDGTTTCPVCGTTASAFIESATRYLDREPIKLVFADNVFPYD